MVGGYAGGRLGAALGAGIGGVTGYGVSSESQVYLKTRVYIIANHIMSVVKMPVGISWPHYYCRAISGHHRYWLADAE